MFDRTIRECVRSGARTPDAVTERCGAGGGCGGCRDSIAAIVDHEAAKEDPRPLVAHRAPDTLAG